MAITDNGGYVKPAMAGLLTLLAAPSAAFAESKFLSLKFLSLSLIPWLEAIRFEVQGGEVVLHRLLPTNQLH